MSKIVYVCVRDPFQSALVANAVSAIADRLLPDNIQHKAPRILQSGGIVAGISNPTDLIAARGTSVAAGHLVDPSEWEKPGTGRPDGAYALFRSDDAVVEIVSDTLASRTVWYVMTDEMFIAATSQRAIVALLRSFHFNPAVVPWILATGSLGPGLSWDRRIRHVAGATTVTLDRIAWSVTERTEPTRFVSRIASDSENERRVADALTHAIGAAEVADPRWAITLSGGVDCRVILSLLKDTTGLRAVTWGLRKSLEDPTSDAQVAKRLAQHFRLEHLYLETDLAEEPIDRVLARFVANGEARIDHLSGYADGFQLWRRMVDVGIQGIIRGDQVFGMKPVRSPRDVRARVGLPLWSDFRELPPLDRFGLLAPDLPAELEPLAGESLDTWRDRLHEKFRVPFVYGALSDLKLPYVEILDPLLSGGLIELIRQLPDALRTNKLLLRRIAHSLAPAIPFATSVAIQPAGEILRSPTVVEFLRDSLRDQSLGSAIPREFTDFVDTGLVQSAMNPRLAARRRLRRAVKSVIPSWAERLRHRAAPSAEPDRNMLALRVYLVSQAGRMYAEDAAAIRPRLLDLIPARIPHKIQLSNCDPQHKVS